jgi:hypothetical protein
MCIPIDHWSYVYLQFVGSYVVGDGNVIEGWILYFLS